MQPCTPWNGTDNIQGKVTSNGQNKIESPHQTEVSRKRRKVEGIEQPPAPFEPDVIPLSLLSLSSKSRLNFIKKFWKMRRNRTYFHLRKLINLRGNALEALETLFKYQGTRLQVKFEYTTCGEVVCEYNIMDAYHCISGLGQSKEEAQLKAAVEALKIFMTPLEFYHVNFISSVAFTKGIEREKLEEALEKIPIQEPLTLLTLMNLESGVPKSHRNFSQYNLLSQEEKIDGIVNFWMEHFGAKKINKFPRVSQLMGAVEIQSHPQCIKAVKSLFDEGDKIGGTSFDSLTYDSWKLMGTCRWRVKGQVFEETLRGSCAEVAETRLACRALEVILGSQLYHSVVHMNKRFIWTDISLERVKKLIDARLDAIPVDGAAALLEDYLKMRNLPSPRYNFMEAFHVKCRVRGKEFGALYAKEDDAKNVAAFQALEHLLGAEIETDRV